VINIAKTMTEVMEVGEGVSVVKGPIRGMCVFILKLVMLRIRRDVSYLIIWVENFIMAQTLIINTGGWKYLVILLHLLKFKKSDLCACKICPIRSLSLPSS